MYQLKINDEIWPVAGSFRIAHGSLTEIHVVNVAIHHAGFVGRGECRPYARYGETTQSVIRDITAVRFQIEDGITSQQLQELLPAGAARNAVDCALWDLKAKLEQAPVWELLSIPKPKPRRTAFTLSIDTPARMAKAAKSAKQYPILKLKIGDFSGLEACLSVLHARPDAQLIIDANESLTPKELIIFRERLAHAPILLIEQPLKDTQFDCIDNRPTELPILCADESLHTRAQLQSLWSAGYRAINVKLDKCGGITEALALMQEAKAIGFLIMAGCMVGTSLAMAPMMTLESYADFIDLDGPLLLAKDIENGIRYDGCIIQPPLAILWG